MNWVDVVLILIIAAAGFAGYQRGLILSMIDLIRWIGSWAAAFFFYDPVSQLLGSITDWTETWRHPIAFVIVAIAAGALIAAAGSRLVRKVKRETHGTRLNRALGLVPGTVSGLILAAVFSALLFAIPLADVVTRAARESVLAERFAVYTEEVESALVPVFDPAIRQTLNRLTTVEPGSRETVDLPFRTESAAAVPALEARMLDLVNRERTVRGLQPLEHDPEMLDVARKHSADMLARGYFSHYTPENKDPFDRMREDDVRFRTAGENLALAPTVEIAHNGLMNSPGHRANILRPQFGRVGIGILDAGKYGIIVTQNFRN